jgi:hypothetical protein
MALDIGVGDGSSLVPAQGEPSLWLEDDAPYWFLHPLFERLAARTGQYIDLYGDASFAGEPLAALKEMLTEARRLAESQPDSWEVHVGTQVSPVHQELYKRLDRAVLLNLLAAWERVVARAEQLGRPVVCFGD